MLLFQVPFAFLADHIWCWKSYGENSENTAGGGELQNGTVGWLNHHFVTCEKSSFSCCKEDPRRCRKACVWHMFCVLRANRFLFLCQSKAVGLVLLRRFVSRLTIQFFLPMAYLSSNIFSYSQQAENLVTSIASFKFFAFIFHVWKEVKNTIQHQQNWKTSELKKKQYGSS